MIEIQAKSWTLQILTFYLNSSIFYSSSNMRLYLHINIGPRVISIIHIILGRKRNINLFSNLPLKKHKNFGNCYAKLPLKWVKSNHKGRSLSTRLGWAFESNTLNLLTALEQYQVSSTKPNPFLALFLVFHYLKSFYCLMQTPSSNSYLATYSYIFLHILLNKKDKIIFY